MTALELVTDAYPMAPADEAHRQLRIAFARVESDYWTMADAVHQAHESEAWLRDDRAHEARYRSIMTEHGLRSVFFAYVYDEFGMREGYVGNIDLAGRLRSAVNPFADAKGLEWGRFTMNVIRPIGAAIIDTYAADDVAAALTTAQRLADKDGTDRVPHPPVKPSHVRAALTHHGLVPPRAKGLSEMEADERKTARVARARDRIVTDATTLIDGQDIGAVVAVVESLIRRLSDQPRAMDRIRKALDGAN